MLTPVPIDTSALRPRSGSPVRVRWLGTAGFSISYEGSTVVVDPYLTRAPLSAVALGRLTADPHLLQLHVPEAHAIVAGHTHFDHVLDVPLLAKLTGARVFGSRSAAALCRAERVPEERVVVVEREPGSEPAVAEVGPFTLRFVPSAHSPLVLGRVPFPGDIVDCAEIPMRAERYRCGAVFGVEISVAGRRIHHVGSAEILDAATLRPGVDLALVCVAGWTTTPRFPERVSRALDPSAVVLSHWDDFFRPVAQPARALPAMQIERLADRMRTALDGRAALGTLPIFGEIAI